MLRHDTAKVAADFPVSVQQAKVKPNAGFVQPTCQHALRKGKRTTNYIFRCQFNGQPSTTPGCPGQHALMMKATSQNRAVMRCGCTCASRSLVRSSFCLSSSFMVDSSPMLSPAPASTRRVRLFISSFSWLIMSLARASYISSVPSVQMRLQLHCITCGRQRQRQRQRLHVNMLSRERSTKHGGTSGLTACALW